MLNVQLHKPPKKLMFEVFKKNNDKTKNAKNNFRNFAIIKHDRLKNKQTISTICVNVKQFLCLIGLFVFPFQVFGNYSFLFLFSFFTIYLLFTFVLSFVCFKKKTNIHKDE